MSFDQKKILIILTLAIISVFLFFFFESGDYFIFKDFFKVVANLWWIIFPIPSWIIFREIWGEYMELNFVIKQEAVLLEIRPPGELEKSPKIMEQVFAGLHTHSTPNKFEIYCGWRPLQDRYTFEIVSLEGEVHFFGRCPKVSRNNLESQIYAQYPDAEITEVEDYLKKFPKNVPNKEWDLWGTALKLFNPDAFPIRTYKNFKEEVTGNMIDPLASFTEVMGNIGKGQNIFFQVIFTPQADKEWHPKSLKEIDKIIGKTDDGEKDYLNNLLAGLGNIITNVFRGFLGQELQFSADSKEEKREFNINQLTPGKQEQVKAIEENISKPGFYTVIRLVYLGKRENFNKAVGVAGPMGALKQFADINLNAFIPDNRTKTFANYFMMESRLAYRQRKIMQEYRDRAFNGQGYTFNTEELASVFHFPDMSVKTPAVHRIEAKKGEAPVNLPTAEELIFE